MKRALKTLAVAAVLSGAAASPAAAGTWGGGGSYCAGGLYNTCFSISLTWTGNVATLTATNLVGEDDLIKAIGLFNLPSAETYVVGGQAGYGPPPPNDLQDLPAQRAYAVTNDQNVMVADGGVGVWTFTFTGKDEAFLDQYLAEASVGAHFISGPGGCSTKWIVNSDGEASGAGGDPDPACGTTTVPEPATMGLLATGLVGLVGVGAIRRRRQKNAV